MSSNIKLLKEIEACRLLMFNLASRNSLSSPKVVEVSQKLDLLLNKFSKDFKQ
ncbi:aspartyl-phosphate phosphatase Spo0E family protein [Peribacillus sp. NPDC058075]|uniref:aspartyl-phosphate phosphatase Spo0E family protein n=1 Tax=unclassified Peribacillus TaxID=2675266 RepID=UPI0036DD98A7